MVENKQQRNHSDLSPKHQTLEIIWKHQIWC